jgi:uncharacterized protein (TIGR02145 family)
MAENLKTITYNDGTAIPVVTDNTAWAALTTPAYCWYNNDDATYKATYGALYNWYAVDVSSNGGKNVCPAGWHLPTDAEWSTLTTYLGGESISGTKLKEAGTSHWRYSNAEVINATDFTALPGGNRNMDGPFFRIRDYGHWWSATSANTVYAWFRVMNGIDSRVTRSNYYKTNGFSVRCLQGEPVPVLPALSTTVPSSVTQTTAVSGGNIASNGGAAVIARGVCWSTNINPTIENSKTSDGAGSGVFESSIEDLIANTTYYVRSYATNSVGTSYGNELILKTFTGTVNDIDGNVYNTLTVGTQLWMAENLKTVNLNDGTAIPQITDNSEWENLSAPAYCWLNNDEATNKAAYGALYNWYTVNTGNLCPQGWQVPTDADWSALVSFLGDESTAGAKMKESGTAHWPFPNRGATNESGFTALPGGYRIYDDDPWGINSGVWWSSTENYLGDALMLLLSSDNNSAERGQLSKNSGFSVRCLKSESASGLPSVTTSNSSFYSNSSAVFGGIINYDGGSPVTERGVFYGTSENPETTGTQLQIGSGSGSFSKIISELTPNIPYFVKAYAVNTTGIAYGSQTTFIINTSSDPQVLLTIRDATSWSAGNWDLSTIQGAIVKLFSNQSSFDSNLPDFTATSDENGIVRLYGFPVFSTFYMITEKDDLSNIKDGLLIKGVFNDQADIDASPVQSGSAIGGLKYYDINADNIINLSDRVWRDGISVPEGETSNSTIIIGK